jgi:hypothetical protein
VNGGIEGKVNEVCLSSPLYTLDPMWQGCSGQTYGKKYTQVSRCINAVVGNLGSQG